MMRGTGMMRDGDSFEENLDDWGKGCTGRA